MKANFGHPDVTFEPLPPTGGNTDPSVTSTIECSTKLVDLSVGLLLDSADVGRAWGQLMKFSQNFVTAISYDAIMISSAIQ
jgi:hypothetical protein